MRDLVRAELIRMRTVRMTGWLLAAVLAMTVVIVLGTVPTDHGPKPDISLDDPLLLARCVGVSIAFTAVVGLVFGILTATQELRFGMTTSAYLVTPRRSRVLLAKLIAAALGGLILAVAVLGLAVALAAVVISLRDGNLTWSQDLGEVVIGGVVVMMLYAVLGVAIGALVRNQIVSVVGCLIWLLLVEQLVVQLVTDIGRWLPSGAAFSVLQLGSSATTTGELLAPWLGVLVFLLYVGVIAGVAAQVTPRRDIT